MVAKIAETLEPVRHPKTSSKARITETLCEFRYENVADPCGIGPARREFRYMSIVRSHATIAVMKIAELFKSTQGEGLLSGTESVFVRTSGCNLRCVYCDTRYASWEPVGMDYSIGDIVEKITMYRVEHVVLTGGEPMLFSELIPLCERLRHLGLHITIETAGTLYLPVECDLMSISPKLSNSVPPSREFPIWSARHNRDRFAPDVIRRLFGEHEYQFKFVIEDQGDLDEVGIYIAEFPELRLDRVMCMPQATTVEQTRRFARWLPQACAVRGWRYCPRQHIEWFGCVAGT